MTRGIFGKLILVFFSTMMLTALVLGGMGAFLYRGMVIHEQQANLIDLGTKVADLIGENDHSPQEVESLLSLAGGRRFALVLYGTDLKVKVQVPPQYVPEDGPMPMIKEALRGRDVLPAADGDREHDMRLAVPVFKGDRVTGAVLVDALDSNKHFLAVNQLLLTSGVTAVAVTFVVAFFLSRSIARPLQEMSAVAKRMAKGDFAHRVAVRSQDEVGQLAQAFNQMSDELAALERMRQEFVAHASHELRSPLTSIRGFVRAFLDGTIPPEKQRPFLERIDRESVRLSNLVDELLDLSQLEEAKPVTDGEATARLDLAVSHAVDTLHPLLQEKDIRLSLDIVPVAVCGREERLVQVVINLLGNAIRFSHPGGRIEVRVRSEQEHGSLQVEDYGIGIPPEELDRVWQRFYKVDKARSSGGTGLGLPIAKRIVELCGGQIHLRSRLQQGTCVTVKVPRVFDTSL